MKINLIVRQINQKADVIKQYMGEAWKKLETIEQIYQNTMMQVFCNVILLFFCICEKTRMASY